MLGLDIHVFISFLVSSCLLNLQQRAITRHPGSFSQSQVERGKIIVGIGSILHYAAYFYFGFAYYWYLPLILFGISILPGFIPFYQLLMVFSPFWPVAYLASIYFEFFS